MAMRIAPKGNRVSRRPMRIINASVNPLSKNWCQWKTKKGGNNNAEFDTHFKLWGNVNRFWNPINSVATAHVDLEPLRAILLTGIFGSYVMKKTRTVHGLLTFKITQ